MTKSRTATILAFVRLSRLHFLLGGFLMYALGAFWVGTPRLYEYLLGQLLVTSAQLTAHYTNEYADFEADTQIQNRTHFSGGSGVLPSGILDKKVALHAAYVTTVVCLCTAVVVSRFSMPAALLGIAALAVSWAYSMPPVRLLSTGTGEAFTAVTVAGLVPGVGALITTNSIPHSLVWVMASLILLQMSMLLAFELPDLGSDAEVGKRVLGVRIGAHKTALLIAFLDALALLVIVIAYLKYVISSDVLMAAVITSPIVISSAVLARTKKYALLTFTSVAAFFLCGVAFLAVQA